ncbi:MAG: GNAT family N-acetyltransferase [Clostridia bacterium]|nr:GNAT family N-acetyltransferase [Clostridia bacterium]
MDVQKAQISDIDALVDLRIRYLKEDHGRLGIQDEETIAEKLPEYFRAHLGKDLFCYIVRDGKDIVSCAFLLVVEKPMSPSFINGKTGMVLNVYTRPAHRQKGYAGLLMKELISDARKMALCSIELKATDAGYSLYRSAGFADDVSKYHLMKWKNQ